MSRELRLAIAIVVACLASRAHAAEPYLVKDINPTTDSADAWPNNFATFAGRAVFAAEKDGDRELWSSDGTEAGTIQLVDACAEDCSSDPRLLASTPIGVFYFVAQGSSERELWLTRGAAGDPVRLAAGLALPQSIRAAWVPELGRLFFTATTAAHGRELWSSDGTVAGTRLVDIRPGPIPSGPLGLVAFKGKLFFFAYGDDKGYALWTSDGTAGGTRLIKRPTSTGGILGPLVALDRSLVFFAGAAGKGSELWRSDGTPAGTYFFADTVKGPGSPSFLSYQALPSKLYLALETPKDGQELWVTDGTPKGTRALTAFARRDAFMFHSTPLYLFPGAFGGRFVFSADDGSHGAEPWITDGSVKGTRLLNDICPGACGSLSLIVGQAGERLLLNATDGQHGFELWSTDGSTAGTRLVGDLCPGDCSSFPLGYDAIGGRRFFLARPADGSTDDTFELWASDGTLAGTERLTDFDSQQFSSIERVATGTRMFFTAPDPQHGRELWVSDGTLAGTHLVRDIADEDLGGSFPSAFQAAGSRLYFAADDGDGESAQLWHTDGTEQGTLRIDDAYSPRPPSFDVYSAAIGTDLVYTRRDVAGNSVWRTDGTAQGTIQLSPSMGRIYAMAAAGGMVFFSLRNQAYEYALWKTDGTAAGTQEVVAFTGGSDGWQPDELTPFGNGIIFRAGSLDHGIEPWRSDGTAAGTSEIGELEPGNGYQTLHGFQTIGGVTYFFTSGDPGLAALELWRTDGTAAGTVPVVQLGGLSDTYGPIWIAQLGAQLLVFLPRGLWVTDSTQAGTRQISTVYRYSSQPASEGPAVFGGRVYFGAFDPVSQRLLLYVSDGTAEGTAPMLDAEGLPIENASSVRVFGGRLTFAAAHGGESALWQSDGTPAGTAPIFRLGPTSFALHEMAVAGSRLYFSARDRDHGEELWALPAEP